MCVCCGCVRTLVIVKADQDVSWDIKHAAKGSTVPSAYSSLCNLSSEVGTVWSVSNYQKL